MLIYEDAYRIICNSMKRNPDIVLGECIYDTENFGNFVIEYERLHKKWSIICDRGELVLCEDSNVEECETLLPTLHDISERQLLDALGL